MNVPSTAAGPADLPWYLSSASLWMGGMSLQGFLFTWLLVGVLDTPADQMGLARSMAELPPLVMLFVGGILADRMNAVRYLTTMHLVMAIPPLVIAAVVAGGRLSYAWVVAFGVFVAAVQSLSDPARQSLLSRVTRLDVQRTVTIMTIATSLVGIGGIYIGGRLESLGLETVLVVQAVLFAAGIVGLTRLPDQPVANRERPDILGGIRQTMRLPLVRNVIGLNFASSLFNAGAYLIVIPYIATEVYAGGAAFLSLVMILFTCGSVGSNVALLTVMPLAHPGRLFLIMQLTRMVILTVLWFEPPLWLFYGAMVAWGLNMGVTTTIVRTTVQELAPASHRAQILSVLLFSFMVSAPISAILLGTLVAEAATPLAGLVPGIAMSGFIFVLGVAGSGLWQYRFQHGAPQS